MEPERPKVGPRRAGPRMVCRRSTTAASTWDEATPALALNRPQGRALGQRRADGLIGGGRDGDADYADWASLRPSPSIRMRPNQRGVLCIAGCLAGLRKGDKHVYYQLDN